MSVELAKKDIKARVFHIVQRRYKDNGEDLLTEEMIEKGLKHKSIKLGAYILHDADKDENGNLKSAHWHIVLSCPNQAKLKSISEWFKVEENFIDLPKGKNCFEDCIAYLTHEETVGKHIYERREIKANFDIEEFFEKRLKEKKKYGRCLTEEERIFAQVMYEGKTLRECKGENMLFYMNNFKKLQEYRHQYLLDSEPPSLRINIYIEGGGGTGKDILSKAIAKSFYPHLEYDEDIYFNVGARGAAFEGYDGQPVMIWSDRRASDLIYELGSRGNVFKVFESHPDKTRQNVKYSHVLLNNTINIINSVEPYEQFLRGLAGEYVDREGKFRTGEDRKQSYRRFPLILRLDVGTYEMLVNRGWLENNDEFLSYIIYGKFVMQLKELEERCGKNKELQNAKRQIEFDTTKEIVMMKKSLEENRQEYSEEEILEMFKDSGVKIEEEIENPFENSRMKK